MVALTTRAGDTEKRQYDNKDTKEGNGPVHDSGGWRQQQQQLGDDSE